ncbi:NXPE family member 3-like [Centropristis striata]|uniref:NXPE family member 3-like n=1 Tax=Centropristis striata TaxID=184440 RepID=UPI0027E14DFB|nr:NXPE family member 3-like [Centropristis striata]
MKTTMKVRAHLSSEFITIFLFLAVAVLILVLYNMDVLEFQQEVKVTIPVPRDSTDSDMHQGFCTLQPLSPEDAVEEILLLETIAWPEPPLLPAPLSLNQTSDPAHSSFTILPRRGGGQWHVGDQLEVLVKMSDFQDRPKKFGGDFLLAQLRNQELGAGVAGQVVDHLNGSYSLIMGIDDTLLIFTDLIHIPKLNRHNRHIYRHILRLKFSFQECKQLIQGLVMLVHPSEAIPVVNRLNNEQPDRIIFKSVFRSGRLSETTICNVCLRPTQQPLCNYTDPRTGEPWFCYKPKKLSCGARVSHIRGDIKNNLENKLLKSGVNMKVYIPASGPASVLVLPKNEGQPEEKSSIVTSGPSGYYYQGAWRALDGTTVHQFNTASTITQCLKGKVVLMYGDSTIRQWFTHFIAALPGLKGFDLHTQKQAGPLMALDYANNILMMFRCHGPPIRFGPVPTTELRYIANELDDVTGGINTVVVLGLWAHFSTFPVEIYIRRLQNIRRAVVRLLDRSPGTLVVIRTANPKKLYETVTISDWCTLQRDKVLRAMFKGLNVHLINAWEMALAHNLPHDLHPQPPIIKNMIDILLSYICPQKGS